MSKFAVITVGRDRPGIVAVVSTALAEMGCNLEDLTTSILRGYFAMVFVLAAPDDATEQSLLQRLETATHELGLRVAVWAVGEDSGHPEPTHVLTVYGEDRMGIVSTVSTYLARHHVNISDMSCRLLDSDVPVYVLRLELAPPDGLAVDRLAEELQATLGPSGLHASLTALETEVL